MKNSYHQSVMVGQVVDQLHVKKGSSYIDATLGTGGHTLEIANKGGMVLGIDADLEMITVAKKRMKGLKNIKLVQGNFVTIDKIAKENDFPEVDGVLFDLGVSNIHLKNLERGFSFENPEADLDMRLDPNTQGVKASDLLNVLREDQIEDLFAVTLEPGAAKWITGRVLHSRAAKPISKVSDLLEICEGLKTGKTGLREGTLPFLALRIAVNSELDNLREVLPKAFDLLKPEGRIVVISFHSKEDEIVKEFFKEKNLRLQARLITFSPVRASITEVSVNRRARSAKMRVIEKS
ncbi:MAG: Ribosomal RNA small subunit methyltransferase H [Candidatus Woesebacteria bacterium GW2011_GWA2_40_7b]|uniref:Ribosomal RNA small subunit methyltransferase H n=1 Tax=Candidatus Woesebacteria bacterium GW2011_GWA2_40_7b TaxID=1618563 RepID=A0A0G0T242_9BACT|nr:MAG: Ribosomal RNA small subunit methyltransferase H [Candidatus Woesebacteria bacterium GW2011_GWA2_40_7b]